jgi:hypothetical protein
MTKTNKSKTKSNEVLTSQSKRKITLAILLA